MKKKNVFIVDDSLTYINELSRELSKEEVYVVGYSLNGKDALEKLRKFNEIDVLIINLVLPIKDGFTVIKELKENKDYYPNIDFIIAQSSIVNPHTLNMLNNLKVDQFILQPSTHDNLINHIKNHNVSLTSNESNKESISKRITKVLHNVGIPAHIKGYHFIREAVDMVIENPNVIGQITKTLYPSIAEKFDSSPTKVERAIRHAIELGWTRGNQDTIDEIFGYTISALKAKPTNSEFIAMVADYISLNEDKNEDKIPQYKYKMSY